MTRGPILAAAALAGAVLGSVGLDTRPARAQDPNRSCTAFQRPDFGGMSETLRTNGMSAQSPLAGRITGFKMRRGCQVFAWKGANFTGQQRVWGQDVSRVGPEWNDQITSWRCVCGNM